MCISPFNNCNKYTCGCAADLSIRVRYIKQYMYYISFRDFWDSPHSSSFDMMLICICSEKCYDVLKILYFQSETFIMQRHIDMLASKCVGVCRHKPCKSCRRTLRCLLRVFAEHASLCSDAFAVQVGPPSPSIHRATIRYGLLSALGGILRVLFLWWTVTLLHLSVHVTILIVLRGILVVVALESSNGGHIAAFHPECIHSAEQCSWFGLPFSWAHCIRPFCLGV